MRNLYLATAFAVALTAATAATAARQETTPSTAPATTTQEEGAAPAKPAKAAKPRKICRNDDHAYSRMPTRTCKTQAEWDALAERQRGTGNIPKSATN